MGEQTQRSRREPLEECSMLTGELKPKVDRIWDGFWSGGISNPLEVIVDAAVIP